MAGARKNDLFGKLQDLSEDAIQRLSDVPGADRVAGALNATKDRVDELQKRVRGLEQLEQRLSALERKVDKLAKGSTATTASGVERQPPTTKSSGAARPKKS
jgi:uncharacterized protein involved in exopolysaccharide biosynthesis